MENNNDNLNQENLQALQRTLQIIANMGNNNDLIRVHTTNAQSEMENNNDNLNQENLQALQRTLQIVANMGNNNDLLNAQSEEKPIEKATLEFKNEKTQKLYDEFNDMITSLGYDKENVSFLKTEVFNVLYEKMAEAKRDGYVHTAKFLNKLRKEVKKILKNAYNTLAKQRVLIKKYKYRMAENLYNETLDIPTTTTILRQLNEGTNSTTALVEDYNKDINDIINSITNYCGKKFFEEELKARQEDDEKEEEEKKQDEDDENDDVDEDEQYKLEEKEYEIEDPQDSDEKSYYRDSEEEEPKEKNIYEKRRDKRKIKRIKKHIKTKHKK